MNTIPDIETFIGDTAPDITFTILRGAAVVPLTGCTVNFKLFNPKTGLQTNVSNQLCAISDAPNGKCVYVWHTNDKPNKGIYKGFVQVTFPNAKFETSKVRVDVQEVGF